MFKIQDANAEDGYAEEEYTLAFIAVAAYTWALLCRMSPRS